YDIFELDDNKVGVLIGDVVGKGLTAAILVASARYAVRSYAYLDPSPSRVMTLVNDALCKEGTDANNVLTAFYAVVDTSNGTMVYASAGHEPPVVCNNRGEVEELCVTGAMLGVIPGAKYRECGRNLRRGDSFVMFTDGITEARHDASILFDKEGVIEHLKKACDAQPDEIASALLEAATLHAGGHLQDDAAIVVMGFEKGR
ncbi:MAG TPA: PP2C family protein-serine/threonine phosphatase, partial [Armatimonadota bacterium]|nr:PP2C family protein-serine/threonine phosphatase [Armatimonadota bacterium]